MLKSKDIVAIGADSFAYELKTCIQEFLNQQGHRVIDLNAESSNRPYYHIANQAGDMIKKGLADKAILLCGTGMGMAIIANKHKGVYAAVCESVQTAMLSRVINDANILTIGAMLVGEFLAIEMVKIWLNTEFANELFEEKITTFLKNTKPEIEKLEAKIFP